MTNPSTQAAVRVAFEHDAEPMGFDIRRYECAAPEPWPEYLDVSTGHRWGGYLAAVHAATTREAALIADYQRLMDKHNALHVNAKTVRDERDQLRACVDTTANVIERQLELIADRAKGDYLDKRPVVQSLKAHVKRLRATLSASAVPVEGV